MSKSTQQYLAPSVREIGSVEEYTRQDFDKIGDATDAASHAIPGITLTGSIVPDQP